MNATIAVMERTRSLVHEKFQFSGKGEVYSFTVVNFPPLRFEKYAPYIVALIKLEEGPMITAQLTDVDPKDVRIGMEVEMVTRELFITEEGLGVYGPKFRPPLTADQNNLEGSK